MSPVTPRVRAVAVTAAGAMLAAVAVVYTVHAADRADTSSAVTSSHVTPGDTAGLYLRTAKGTVAVQPTARTTRPPTAS
ncbi:hypothetical protein [Streptomyces sp. NPDC060054]|uniref:hypothetical protein n=1 Tax=Streptomyces sp. NPDC060054 TaxID=3347048 RepID=UPI0036A24E23